MDVRKAHSPLIEMVSASLDLIVYIQKLPTPLSLDLDQVHALGLVEVTLAGHSLVPSTENGLKHP